MITLRLPDVPSGIVSRIDRDAVDPVVGGGIVLLQPVDHATLVDRDTVLAHAAGLAVDGVLAVEDLGQDARGGGLAGPARSAEEVGVADPVLGDGGSQGPHDVFLSPQLVEPLRPVSAVQRLVSLGHRATLPVAANGPAPPCDGQAICGTPQAPLRAAASRP